MSSTGSDDSGRLIWLDGELRPWAEATIHVLSHAVQRGSLVFDYMSVHELPEGNAAGHPAGAAVFRLAQHVERFFHSCALMGLPVEQDGDAIAAAICNADPAGARRASEEHIDYVRGTLSEAEQLDQRERLAELRRVKPLKKSARS